MWLAVIEQCEILTVPDSTSTAPPTTDEVLAEAVARLPVITQPESANDP